MLGIQNSLPVANSVKFGHNPEQDYAENDDYYYYDSSEAEPDSFSKEKEAINRERDEKLGQINGVKEDFDNLAQTIENNPGSISKKTGKALRFISAVCGIAGTFVLAKYGSKVTIGGLREFTKSKTGQSIVTNAKSVATPVRNAFNKVGGFIKDSAFVKNLKNTKVGKFAANVAEKPMVKNVIEKAQGYAEAAKTLVKSINGDKVQNAIENTMAASTTASVLIDDLAGRNDNKSNLDLALGASGGDK